MRLSLIIFLFIIELFFQLNSSCCFGQSKRIEKRKRGSLILETYGVDVLLSEFSSDTIKFNLDMGIFLADSTAIDRVYAFRGKDFFQYEFKDGETSIGSFLLKDDFYMDGDNILHVEAGQWYYEVLLIPGIYALVLQLDKEEEGRLLVIYRTGLIHLY